MRLSALLLLLVSLPSVPNSQFTTVNDAPPLEVMHSLKLLRFSFLSLHITNYKYDLQDKDKIESFTRFAQQALSIQDVFQKIDVRIHPVSLFIESDELFHFVLRMVEQQIVRTETAVFIQYNADRFLLQQIYYLQNYYRDIGAVNYLADLDLLYRTFADLMALRKEILTRMNSINQNKEEIRLIREFVDDYIDYLQPRKTWIQTAYKKDYMHPCMTYKQYGELRNNNKAFVEEHQLSGLEQIICDDSYYRKQLGRNIKQQQELVDELREVVRAVVEQIPDASFQGTLVVLVEYFDNKNAIDSSHLSYGITKSNLSELAEQIPKANSGLKYIYYLLEKSDIEKEARYFRERVNTVLSEDTH
jgi:hypothetical protein